MAKFKIKPRETGHLKSINEGIKPSQVPKNGALIQKRTLLEENISHSKRKILQRKKSTNARSPKTKTRSQKEKTDLEQGHCSYPGSSCPTRDV